MAFCPLALNKGIADSGIERIVTDGYILTFKFRIAKYVRPVIKVVNLNAFAGDDFRCPSRGCWQRENQELAVVCNNSVHPIPGIRKSRRKSIPRALAKRRMVHRVIDFMGIFGQSLMKLFKWPDRLSFGIHRLGHLPRPNRKLRVALQIVDELGIGCSEEPFANRAETGFRGGPDLLGRFISCEECLKVGALELTPAIHYYDLR